MTFTTVTQKKLGDDEYVKSLASGASNCKTSRHSMASVFKNQVGEDKSVFVLFFFFKKNFVDSIRVEKSDEDKISFICDIIYFPKNMIFEQLLADDEKIIGVFLIFFFAIIWFCSFNMISKFRKSCWIFSKNSQHCIKIGTSMCSSLFFLISWKANCFRCLATLQTLGILGQLQLQVAEKQGVG